MKQSPSGKFCRATGHSFLFDTAVKMHLSGNIDGALAGYDEILAKLPAHAEANSNAGAIRAQRGDLDLAMHHFRRAIHAQPLFAEAQHSLGLALHLAGSHTDSIAAFRRAVFLNPRSVDWWTDLATALTAEGFLAEGLEANDRALALARDNPQSLANRAVPLRGLQRRDEAIDACRASLGMRPDHVDTLVNLGMILRESGDFDEAARAFDRALILAPHHAKARANIATLLLQLNKPAEARAIAEELVLETPDTLDSWTLLGICAQEAAEWELAEHCQREALARSSDHPIARWNLAQLTLLRGNFTEGFLQFEARKRLDVFMRHSQEVPEWNGEPLIGKTLLVHAEQGFGDAIQFVRFLPLLKARGASRVILDACPPELASLLRSATGIDELVVRGMSPPPFDTHTYLLSLPHLLDTTRETVPSDVPYITAPERPIKSVIRAHEQTLRVGLVWGGNPSQPRDRMRSVTLDRLAPILATQGVTFFSLQKGEAARQLDGIDVMNIINLDPLLTDFSDTAAAIAALDLIITVDTAVAHLAGALGKPVWVLLPHVACWRYLLDREDSIWYPTMRIFRQPAPNDWSVPVASAAAALAKSANAQDFGIRQTAMRMPRSARPTVGPAVRADDAVRQPIEIDWQIGFTSGWGTYGLHLALALHRSVKAEPILATAPSLQGVNPIIEHQVRRMRREIPAGRDGDTIHLTALGNHVRGGPLESRSVRGRRAGIIFFEDTELDAAAVTRAGRFDVMIGGSTWNVDVLRAAGVERTHLVLQGVDPSLFHPAPRTGVIGARFLVFSGGKLEFRKGQDIVIEAFRRFHAKHADAILVTAWHNHWPQSMTEIDAMGHVRGFPNVRNGRCDIAPWLHANGLRPDAFIDLGLQPQPAIAQMLREMDVAVFTNRCEGGTNLVAMEAMACGVPTILSDNTGHRDLIQDDRCFPLTRQSEISVKTKSFGGTRDWGESDPEEVVALLERVYHDRAEARRRGAGGAQFLHGLSWATQANEILKHLDV